MSQMKTFWFQKLRYGFLIELGSKSVDVCDLMICYSFLTLHFKNEIPQVCKYNKFIRFTYIKYVICFCMGSPETSLFSKNVRWGPQSCLAHILWALWVPSWGRPWVPPRDSLHAHFGPGFPGSLVLMPCGPKGRAPYCCSTYPDRPASSPSCQDYVCICKLV